MKCKIFEGTWYEAQDAFNQWAKGKRLTKDVIIHTHVTQQGLKHIEARIAIIVFHPDTPEWDKTGE